MRTKGDTWNESSTHKDPVSGRTVRRITTDGLWNEHAGKIATNTAFTDDGEHLVFIRAERGQYTLVKCHVPTGELTQLIDPVEGFARNIDATSDSVSMYKDRGGLMPVRVRIIQRRRKVIYAYRETLRLVDLDTLEETVLIEDFGRDWVAKFLSVKHDGTLATFNVEPRNPVTMGGEPPSKYYNERLAGNPQARRLFKISLADERVELLFDEDCPMSYGYSSTNNDIVQISRKMDSGSKQQSFIIRLSTGNVERVHPHSGGKKTLHAAGAWDGEHTYYHGRMRSGSPGLFFGVSDMLGRTVWEHEFPEAHGPGHVAAVPHVQAILIDGNHLSHGKLSYLHFGEDEPRIEDIVVHGNDWDGELGQRAHVHPQCDPTGRWIVYSVAKNKRSDMYVVKL